MGIYKRLFLLYLLFLCIFPLACDNNSEVFYYLYFDISSLTVFQGEDINFSQLSFESNIDTDDIILTSDSDILSIDALTIHALSSGLCKLYVWKRGLDQIISSLDVIVVREDSVSHQEGDDSIEEASLYSFTSSSFFQNEKIFYTISILKNKEPFGEFDLLCDNSSITISKMMNNIFLSCKVDEIFVIRIIDRSSDTFFKIEFPLD